MDYIVGEKYNFSVTKIVDDKYSLIKNEEGDEYHFPGILQYPNGVDLIFVNSRIVNDVNKIFFSQEFSDDSRFKWNDTLRLQIIAIKPSNKGSWLTCKYGDDLFVIPYTGKSTFDTDDWIICKIASIANNNIKFWVLSRDFGSLYDVDTIYIFPVVEITKEDANCYIHFNVENQIVKLKCNEWIKQVESEILRVEVEYKEEGRWFLLNDRLASQFFETGKEYPIKILSFPDNSQDSFCRGETEYGITINVVRPFNINNAIEGLNKTFSYNYVGIDKGGFLEFKQNVVFESIIESIALKVIAFDNLRKEYKSNTTFYEKLFKDYDANSNLWLLTYGNALYEVIEDKLKNEEFDIAYLLLEVLVKIETWILESGYLYSFSKEKRLNIESTALQKIKIAKRKSEATLILLKNDFSALYEKIEKNFSFSNLLGLSENISVFIDCLKINKNLFNDGTKILQLLIDKRTFVKQHSQELSIPILQKIVSEILFNNEKIIFNEVFINPVKRQRYFSGNEQIKTCAIISIWLAAIENSEAKKFYWNLKTIRYVIYYTNDIDQQEKLICFTLDKIFGNSLSFGVSLGKINLYDLDLNEISNIISQKAIASRSSEKKIIDKIVSGKISYSNALGHIIHSDGLTIAIPYKENNIDIKNGQTIDCEIIASDPYTSLCLGTRISSYHLNITKSELQEVMPGAFMKGVIKSIVDFGMFVTVGGRDGLLHSSKVSYNSTELNEIFNVGDEILVKVEDVNNEKISLDRLSIIKQSALNNLYQKNDTVKGIVYRIDERYGIYLELENGALGHINKGQYCINKKPLRINDFFKIGEIVETNVLGFSRKGNGYDLSSIKPFKGKKIEDIIQKGIKYKARIIVIGDIRWQIEQRLNLNVDWNNFPSKYYCPKCQKNDYINVNVDSISNFKIELENKSWNCTNCNYGGKENIILKFLSFPLTGYVYLDSIEDPAKYLGIDVEITVEEIRDSTYILCSIVDINKVAIIDESNIQISVKIAVELGFLYEQFESIADYGKEDMLSLCRYYFGLAKNARSYFYEFFIEYKKFIDSIQKYDNEGIESLHDTANTLYKYFNSEMQAIETFPVLTNILESLKVLSNLKSQSIENTNALCSYIMDNKNTELTEIINLVIAYNSISIKHIKEDIWGEIKTNLKNNLRLIQDDNIDEDTLNIRKRIKEILKDNKETEQIECKSTLEYPVPSKEDLKYISVLENKFKNESDERRLTEILTKIKSLKFPLATNDIKKIINIQWIKTIAAFANTNGGELLIGIGEDVKDNLYLLEIDKDIAHFKSEDKMLLAFDDRFANYIGNLFQHLVKAQIIKMGNDKSILYVTVAKSQMPVFVKIDKQDKFYIRRNRSSSELSMKEFSDYKELRFNQSNL